MDVLRVPATAQAAAQQNNNVPPQPGQPPIQPAANLGHFQQAFFAHLIAQQQARNLNNNNPANAAPPAPQPPSPPPAPQQPQTNQTHQTPPSAPQQGVGPTTPTTPAFVPFAMTMMMGPPPTMPMPPANLSQLSPEQLILMEGRERANVEARIRCLQDIRTLLDAAAIQLQQYQAIAARVPPVVIPTASTSSASEPVVPARQTTLDEPQPSSSRSNGAASVPDATSNQTENQPVELSEEDKAKEEIRQRRLERFSRTDPPVGISGRLEDQPGTSSEDTNASTSKKDN